MTGRKVLITDSQRTSPAQHRQPCSDCPWRRDSVAGWLGPHTGDEWLAHAHGESIAECHVITNQQCAGMAIYRANVVKRCRHADALILPVNRQTVFATPQEFLEHHENRKTKPR